MSIRTSHRQSGPPLAVPAAVALGLTVAAALVFARGPRPATDGTTALAYLQAHRAQVRVLAFLVFATAFPIGVYSATMYRRLRRLGITAPGAAIALVGGTLASASLVLSGLVSWAAAEAAPDLAPGVARALVDLAFAAGGPGFAVPLALLLAGVAVPVLMLRINARALSWFGLALAVAGVLASLSLLSSALYPLLPVVRFGGLVWLIVAGVLLPLTRHQVSATDR